MDSPFLLSLMLTPSASFTGWRIVCDKYYERIERMSFVHRKDPVSVLEMLEECLGKLKSWYLYREWLKGKKRAHEIVYCPARNNVFGFVVNRYGKLVFRPCECKESGEESIVVCDKEMFLRETQKFHFQLLFMLGPPTCFVDSIRVMMDGSVLHSPITFESLFGSIN